MTAIAKLEARIAALEAEVAALKNQGNGETGSWVDRIYGAFEGDLAYEEAMRLGKKWRDSSKPKPRKRKKVTNGRARHRSR